MSALRIIALEVKYYGFTVVTNMESMSANISKFQVTCDRIQLTRWLVRRVCAFDVALQLEWGGKLTVTVLAGSVAFPTFTALLLKLQVMFHVVHKPLNDSEQMQKSYI